MSKCKSLLVATATALAIAGCGGSSSRLTDPQKQIFTDTLSSVGRTASAAKRARRTASTHSSFTPAPASALGDTMIAADPTEMMAQKMMAGACDVKGPDFSGYGTSFKFGLSAHGDTCPVEMKLAATIENTLASMELSYAVKDEEFKKLNDVIGFTFKGGISGSQTSATIDGSGVILSQKYKEIPIRVSGSGSGSQSASDSSFTISVTFPEFTVELKHQVRVDSSGLKSTTFLNGEEITQQQLSDLMKRGMGEAMPSQASPSESTFPSPHPFPAPGGTPQPPWTPAPQPPWTPAPQPPTFPGGTPQPPTFPGQPFPGQP
jgi:hypothetical protein